MISLDALLAQLKQHDIRLQVEGESLKYSAPPGALTPEIREALRHHKSALLDTLRRVQDPSSASGAVIGMVAWPDPLPLSFAQERMWFLHQMEGDRPAYNVFKAARLKGGALEVDALEGALTELVRRHEALRTCFPTRAGSPYQCILPPGPQRLPVMNLQPLRAGEQEARLQAAAHEFGRRFFDLEKGPLFRAMLVCLAPQEHVLFIGMHHIITDGWSLDILFGELGELYQARVEDRPARLNKAPLQYGDFTLWQREHLQASRLDPLLEAWRKQLEGAPAALSLYSDKPRPAVAANRGEDVFFHIAPDLTAAIRSLCEVEGTTPFMVLLAAYAVLLHRYSGMDDLIIGAPVANRTHTETEDIFGLFVNTIPLRLDLSGDPPFLDILRRVRETSIAALALQDVPFELLVEALQLERDLSRNPLFQVMFAFQSRPSIPSAFGPFDVEAVHVPLGTSILDINFMVWAGRETFTCQWNYDSDLFKRETAQQMVHHLLAVLQAVVDNASITIDAIPLLDDDERRVLLEVWSPPHPACDDAAGVHALFAAQAAETPDAVAVEFGDEQLSYRELERRANQLAHALQKRGVGPDSLVAICLQRSFNAMVAVLGVLKAGGAYVPLDPVYPQVRLAFMLEDSGAEVVLADEGTAGRFAAAEAEVLVLAHDDAALAQEAPTTPAVAVDGNHLAYVMYTSGSTGVPKAVAMPHRALVNLIRWQLRETVNPRAKTLQFTTLSFDLSFLEIFATWCAGGTLVLLHDEQAGDMQAVSRVLAAEKVERLFLPFAALQNLAEVVSGAVCDALLLKEVISTGEQLRITPEIRRFFSSLQGCALINLYGPTETHVISAHQLGGGPEDWPLLPPIGRPIDNVQLYILDEHLQPVPIGVAGELYVGGCALARGYHDRPAQDRARFLPHPFQREARTRVYKTGDQARYLKNGEIEFLGRKDQQVKVRGYRIEFGEIEHHLQRLPTVRAAIVTAPENRHGERELAAYIVMKAGMEMSPAQLRDALREELPEYMLPSFFIQLERIPLTPNGKVDRRALPPPSRQRWQEEGFAAPRNPVEEALAAIWAEVLELESIGIHASFFDLGGHSLLATKVVARIRDVFHVELPLRQLFGAGVTIAGLAKLVNELQLLAGGRQDSKDAGAFTGERHEVPIVTPHLEGAGAPLDKLTAMSVKLPPAADDPVLGKRARPDVLPLSFAQERMWFLHQMEGHQPTSNIFRALRIRNRLDVNALEQSLTELVRRHEALRTCFPLEGGNPSQRILPPISHHLNLEDLQSLPGDVQAAQLQKLMRAFGDRHLNLEDGPLFHTRLVRLAPDDHVLLIGMHHIITDGWSLDVFYAELGKLYTSFSSGRPSRLDDPPLQYADFTLWQREWLNEERLQMLVDGWREQLAGAPEIIRLLTDKPRPAVATFKGGEIPFRIEPDLAGRLKVLGEKAGTTRFMTLLAAYAALLQLYNSMDEFVIGSPIANRTRSELERVMGFFVNTLPLRIDLSGNPTFMELLKRVRETSLAAYSLQELPFEILIQELAAKRDISRNPLFQVMFAFQAEPPVPERMGPFEVEAVDLPWSVSIVDLSLMIWDGPEGISGKWMYAEDLFTRETAVQMVQHMRALLEAVVQNPARHLSEINLLSDEELQMQLEEWNPLYECDEDTRCIHNLFEAQVERKPDAIAVRCGDDEFTYRQLNQYANQIARVLVERGLQPEMFVGVFLERSIRTISSLLAVMKAGGAYVPLSPIYPPGRTASILDDIGMHTIISEEGTRSSLPPHDVPVLDLDGDAALIQSQPGGNLNADVAPGQLMYMIYTSGSTGRPKGTLVEHRNAMSVLASLMVEPGMTEVDTLLSMSPAIFDMATYEFFLPLMAGGRIVMVDRETARDGFRLKDALGSSQVTVMIATPATWRLLLEAGWEGDAGLKILCGGEKLDQDLAQALLDRGSALWNVYGPTETTIICAIYHVEMSEEIVPIGKPIANTQIYLMDPGLQLVPTGVPGEIVIGGGGVTRGYHQRAELTADRFVPNPFPGREGALLYRTGDLGRRRPDGAIEFLGRLDQQVKLRGFRVELGEIETILGRMPAVQSCVVLMRGDLPINEQLAAYIVPATGSRFDIADIKRELGRTLPEYMIPASFTMIASLPLTPSGKVDRRALPEPDSLRPEEHEKWLLPRDVLERRIAAVWEQVLGRYPVGAKDDFFELGGHSLLAVRLIAGLAEATGITLPVAAMFQAPTVEAQAELIRGEGWIGTDSSLVPIRTGGEEPPLFFVHWAGGNVLIYRQLAHLLPDAHTIYGVQAVGLDGTIRPHTTVEQMAQQYIEDVRAVQPSGPYYLGGASLGGSIAFEMARQLRCMGEEVGLVALFDTYGRPQHSPLPVPQRVGLHVQQLKERSSMGKVRYLTERTRIRLTRFFYRAWIWSGIPLPRVMWKVKHTTYYAARAYLPGPYDGDILLFRAEERGATGTTAQLLGWDAVEGVHLRTIPVPGTHATLLAEPGVEVVAQVLSGILERHSGGAAEEVG